METTRQQKIARLIQKELADLFLKESKRLFTGALITVTKTYVSKDLSVARIYISLFSPQDKKKVFELIVHHTRELRVELAARVKNQLRIVPHLEFFIDDSLDYIENIDRLLKE
ncbi:MAG: 30S ribosome-binding factor RbfA [Bacteroidetes bacterium]|nr:30S ribosome-binding factor RbfA [Bacteroidota bacterium]